MKFQKKLKKINLIKNIYNQVVKSCSSSSSEGRTLGLVIVKFVFQSSTRSVDFLILSGSVPMKRRVLSVLSDFASSIELAVGVFA